MARDMKNAYIHHIPLAVSLGAYLDSLNLLYGIFLL